MKPPPLLADLRKEMDLTRYFSVSHPIEKSVVLSVSSDRDGVLFNGNWSTDTHVLVPPQLPVRFTTAGARTITLSAHLAGSAKTVTGTFVVDVVNSAPQVAWQYTGTVFQGEPFSINALLSFGVYARETTGTLAKFCGEVAQPSGATLDLRAQGCSATGLGLNPPRFLGAVTVENPSGEALGYQWTLHVKTAAGTDFIELYGATGPTFDLFAFGNAQLVTRDCHVDVTVVAPQPERSKRVTAWSGQCIYFASVLN